MSNKIKKYNTGYILLPVIIGLSVITIMFYREFNPALLKDIKFTWQTAFYILLAIFFMFSRDVGLIWRYRYITDKQLSWKQAFNVNVLCEFTSAVTPSSVGGSSLIVWFLNREGIEAGRSTALMITCLFLDELFLVIATLLILLLFPFNILFSNTTIITSSAEILFFIIYSAIALWTLMLYIALFHKPHWIGNLLRKLFSLRFLKKWCIPIYNLADNLENSSHEISKRPISFWNKAFILTIFSWVSRYLVVVALLLAFNSSGNYFLAFARQFVLWIRMGISPTPGGSGLSEFMFKEYYSDFFTVTGMALVVAFIWRIITYYMYLLLGTIIVPGWLKSTSKIDKDSAIK